MNFDPFPHDPTDHDLNELEDELQLDDEFRLGPPVDQPEDWDDDSSIGELSTNDSIIIDDSRDLIDMDEPIDYCGDDYCGYEDYEPNVYDGTYSEE